MKELIVATTNQGKVKEIQAMLKDLNIEVKSLKDVYDDVPDIVEDGVNGFLTEANSPEQMADRLEQVLSMGNGQKTRMSTANVCRIKELCSEDVFVKKYLNLIG